MRVPRKKYLYEDVDFFCIDRAGKVGHFTSFGLGGIPESVAKELAALEEAVAWFESLPLDFSGVDVSSSKTGREFEPWLESARKGLFAFDALGPETYGQCFRKIATPVTPLLAGAIPARVVAGIPELNDIHDFGAVAILPISAFGGLAP
jgi:hypothetical protein